MAKNGAYINIRGFDKLHIHTNIKCVFPIQNYRGMIEDRIAI